jgi:hypothetical protein
MEIIFILAVALALTYYMFRTIRKKLADNIVLVRNIAVEHGWEFYERPQPNEYMHISDAIGLQPNTISVRYLVRGSHNGKVFELFLIIGALRRRRLIGTYGNASIGYATLIRTRQSVQLPETLPPLFYSVTQDEWNYIVYRANAINRQELQSLIDYL